MLVFTVNRPTPSISNAELLRTPFWNVPRKLEIQMAIWKTVLSACGFLRRCFPKTAFNIPISFAHYLYCRHQVGGLWFFFASAGRTVKKKLTKKSVCFRCAAGLKCSPSHKPRWITLGPAANPTANLLHMFSRGIKGPAETSPRSRRSISSVSWPGVRGLFHLAMSLSVWWLYETFEVKTDMDMLCWGGGGAIKETN